MRSGHRPTIRSPSARIPAPPRPPPPHARSRRMVVRSPSIRTRLHTEPCSAGTCAGARRPSPSTSLRPSRHQRLRAGRETVGRTDQAFRARERSIAASPDSARVVMGMECPLLRRVALPSACHDNRHRRSDRCGATPDDAKHGHCEHNRPQRRDRVVSGTIAGHMAHRMIAPRLDAALVYRPPRSESTAARALACPQSRAAGGTATGAASRPGQAATPARGGRREANVCRDLFERHRRGMGSGARTDPGTSACARARPSLRSPFHLGWLPSIAMKKNTVFSVAKGEAKNLSTLDPPGASLRMLART